MLILGLIVQTFILYLVFQVITLAIGRGSLSYLIKAQGKTFFVAFITALTINVLPDLLRPKTDLNPLVSTRELIGSWKSSQRTLKLSENVYTLQSNESVIKGKWRHYDFNIYLSKPGGSEYLRAIKYGDSYRLLIDSENKMADMYDYNHAFIKQ
ncbi:hypothetical protein EOL70_11355 [Leucothrix sargassi]|nr:hypothetical protein EOL70_11355 [Leucothrix sargassi]